MNEDQIRRGNTQASFNEEMSGPYLAQFAFLGLVAGIMQSMGNIPFIPKDWSSWMIGIITLISSIILSMIPKVSQIFLILLTLMWGFIGFEMAGGDVGSGTSWAFAILATIIAAGLNMSGMQWSKDIN
jgi:hypothetical protein